MAEVTFSTFDAVLLSGDPVAAERFKPDEGGRVGSETNLHFGLIYLSKIVLSPTFRRS